ncbi:MAG: hypothetical protein RLZZ58_41 [Pseudomonadota bacterium]|jgi:catechol 2,3-dioxygenase-like lactoylglutathione lyase family enzyme
MEPIVANLLDNYESGRLSRRDLVTGLSVLAAGAVAAPAVAQVVATAPGSEGAPVPVPPFMQPTAIDHVSLLVADLQRSTEFYNRLFGLVVVSENPTYKIVRLGLKSVDDAPQRVMVSLRQKPPIGTVDHWAFRIKEFDVPAATAYLKDQGITPDFNAEYGFYVTDPDGVVVQMVGPLPGEFGQPAAQPKP